MYDRIARTRTTIIGTMIEKTSLTVFKESSSASFANQNTMKKNIKTEQCKK